MSTEANKTLVRHYFEAGNRNDFVAWDHLCASDMVLYTGFTEPMQGLEAVKQFSVTFHNAFSDFFLRIEDMVAEGDRVAARWTTGGVHTAPLASPGGVIPPTGKEMAMSGMSILRLADGKIVEERVQADVFGGMQQLGVIP